MIHIILGTVSPVFAIIALGYIFARFKPLPLSQLTDLLIYIFIPALVLSSLLEQQAALSDLGLMMAAVLVIVGGCAVLTFIYLRASVRRHGAPDIAAVLLPTMFCNAANLPLPLASLAFGQAGLAAQVLFMLPNALLVNTVGVAIACGRGGIKETFRLPLVYAVVLGFTLNALDATPPPPVMNVLELLAAPAIPLMLFCLGYRLRGFLINNLGTAVTLSLIRIAGGLALGVLAVHLFSIEGELRRAILLGSAMPAAVMNYVLAQKYERQPDLVASTIMISTLLSLITTSLLLGYLIG